MYIVTLNQIWIVIMLFRLNLSPNEIPFGLLNQSEKSGYNSNLVKLYKIQKSIHLYDKMTRGPWTNDTWAPAP